MCCTKNHPVQEVNQACLVTSELQCFGDGTFRYGNIRSSTSWRIWKWTSQIMKFIPNWKKIFLQNSLRDMLEVRDCRVLDLLITFVPLYVYIWRGYEDEASLTKIHIQCSELTSSLISGKRFKGCLLTTWRRCSVQCTTLRKQFELCLVQIVSTVWMHLSYIFYIIFEMT